MPKKKLYEVVFQAFERSDVNWTIMLTDEEFENYEQNEKLMKELKDGFASRLESWYFLQPFESGRIPWWSGSLKWKELEDYARDFYWPEYKF